MPPTSAPRGRFYVQRPGKIRIRLCAAERAPHRGRRVILSPSRIPTCKTVEKYPIQSTPFRLLLCGRGRSRPRCAHRRGREPGRHARHLARGQGGRRGRQHQALCSTASRELKLKQWLITDAQGLDDAGDRQRHRVGAKGRGRLLHLDGRLPALPLRPVRRPADTPSGPSVEAFNKLMSCGHAQGIPLRRVKFFAERRLKSL